MNICRLCLFKGTIDNFVGIFEDTLDDLSSKIKDCLALAVTESDLLPKTICQACLHQIKQWSKFKEHSWETNRILLLTYETSIKQKSDIGPTEVPHDSITACINSETKENEVLINESTITNDDRLSNKLNDLGLENRNDIAGTSNLDQAEVSDSKGNEIGKQHHRSKKKKKKSAIVATNIAAVGDYKCDICSKTFSTCFEHLDHQATHDGKVSYKCGQCDKEYTTRDDLLEHEFEHKKTIKSACTLCGKHILRSSMKAHMTQHTDKHKCRLCETRCSTRSMLVAHHMAVHTHERPHCCATCGKSFATLTTLKVHAATHSDERTYKCPVVGDACNYAARTSSSLLSHVIRMHPAQRKGDGHGSICNKCGKTFKSSKNLADHVRRVHNKKTHECQFCGTKFAERYILATHLKSHTGEKTFKCTVCSKEFARSDGLKNHLETHQRRMMFDCKSCGKKFISKRSVARHSCSAIL